MHFELTIIDEWEEVHQIYYTLNQYPSLMELIRNQLYSDIGDCRGRAWCNTCVVQAQNETVSTVLIDPEERKLLDQINIEKVRLSCQLPLTKSLHQTTWKILESRALI